MSTTIEQSITEKIASFYGFYKYTGKSGGYKCFKCGKHYKPNAINAPINERMINHNCANTISGSVSSSRN